MNKELFELQADICKTLAHPLRLQIIELLYKNELCFSDILEKTGGIKSTLSQQLSLMVEKGILKSRRDSRCIYFSLSSVKVYKACMLMREVLVDKINKRKKIIHAAGL